MDRSFAGCYEARRASALSGVPISTLHYWSTHGVLVPSISPVRIKLWSYADLLALRMISWLRRPKEAHDVARSPMGEVRRALQRLDEMDLDIWRSGEQSPLVVDRAGRILIRSLDGVEDLEGQGRMAHFLDLLGPFDADGLPGPDLRSPRPRLRIIPGKVSGEPHAVGSRITTRSLAALDRRGFPVAQIHALYPDLHIDAVSQAIDLELQLAGDLARAA